MNTLRSEGLIAASLVSALAAVAATGGTNAALAATQHSSTFSVAYLGIPVGKMTNSIRINDNKYAISGAVKANSMLSLVAKTKASFSSSGTIAGTRIVPATHTYTFKTSKKQGTLQMSFSGGDVKKVSASPVIKYKPGTVPVEKSHLDNVIDPLSSLLFAVEDSEIGNGAKICDRTMPLFDGRQRINLRFSYKATGSSNVEGFSGDTFTCAVRYQAVSGIRPFKKDIKFMTANKDMQVTVARIGKTNLYTLFGFRVRTDKGVVSGEAYRFVTE